MRGRLDDKECHRCSDFRGTLPFRVFVGPGGEMPPMGQDFRRFDGGSGLIYDKRFLAEYFLVGISLGCWNWSDFVCRHKGKEAVRRRKRRIS